MKRQSQDLLLVLLLAACSLSGCSLGTLFSDDRHYDRWDSFRKEGYRARSQGDQDLSVKSYTSALKEAESINQKPQLATSVKELADAYQAQENYVQSRPLYERALSLFESLEKDGSPVQVDLAETQTNLADIHRLAGENAEAEKHYKAAYALEEASSTVPISLKQRTVEGYGHLLRQQGRDKEADTLAARVELLPDDLETQTIPVTAWKSVRLAGRAAFARKDYVLAHKLYREALNQAEPFAATDNCLPTSLNDMAEFELKVHHDKQKAESLYKRALSVRQQELGPDDPELDCDLVALIEIYLEQGKFAQAEPLLRQQSRIREKQLGAHSCKLAESLYQLGASCAKLEKYSEAATILHRARDIYSEGSGTNSAQAAQCSKLYADTLKKLGRTAETQSLVEQASDRRH